MKGILLVMGMAFMMLIAAAQAAEYQCDTCDSCNTLIASAFPGDIISLNASLYSDVSGCILVSSVSDIYIDCAGYSITSSAVAFGGINMISASNVTVSNCSMLSGWDNAIFLNSDSNVTVKNCTLYGNSNGIYFYGGSQNLITGNSITYNNIGLIFESSDQIIDGNDIMLNNYGIAFYGGTRNIFRDNNISGQNYIGTFVVDGGNYYYNNLFNNTINVEVLTANADIWNIGRAIAGINIVGGSSKGGNYWAYPNGTGFSEICADAGSTGICDLEYDISGANIDYLPLSSPGASPPSPGAECISNITLRSFYNEQSLVMNDTGNYSTSTSGYKDSACQWGCDSSAVPASCRISPLESSIYFFAFIAVILVVAGVIYTRKR